MRVWLRAHAHSVTVFSVMMAIAILLGNVQGVDAGPRAPAALPAPAIDLPGPDEDADLDTYADTVDRVDGDAHIRIAIESLRAPGIRPYFVLGTQDDQWRFGEGRALEWPHVVDADPLGYPVASDAWKDHAIRTGAWWYSVPMEGEQRIIAEHGLLPEDAEIAGVEWPQVLHANVRDDADRVTLELTLMDERPRPDRTVAAWTIVANLTSGAWSTGFGQAASGAALEIAGDVDIKLRVEVTSGIARSDQQAIADRWAPIIHFDSQEAFYPTSGDLMERFHGFSRIGPDEGDLRTWTRTFDNGRDHYLLLLADYDGNGEIDHRDAAIMTDVLREGTGDVVYANVLPTHGDRVVVQYWFVYMYNFVWDVAGDDIEALAHEGDREFIQLTFADLDAARNGTPESVAYSQHYQGIRIEAPDLEAAPFNGTHIAVYPARGAHASYPAPGDDRRFRGALARYGDRFDGLGETWGPGNYTVELFGHQAWAFGHRWAPPTRHSRDLGTATKPLLTYDFHYPYIDPIPWALDLKVLDQDELAAVYGSSA